MPQTLLLAVGKLAAVAAPYVLPTLVAFFLLGAVLRWCAFQKFRSAYAFLSDVEKQVFQKRRDVGAPWPLSAKQVFDKAFAEHFGQAKGGVRPSFGARLRQKFFRVQPGVRALVSDLVEQFQRTPVSPTGTDFTERARVALGHNPGLSTLFGLMPLGTTHRLLSAFPGIVVLVGSFGTVAVVFTVLPEISRTPDSVDVAREMMSGWSRALQVGLSHTVFGIFFGGVLHLFNRWWDGEKSFQNSVHKLGGILSLLWQESGARAPEAHVFEKHEEAEEEEEEEELETTNVAPIPPPAAEIPEEMAELNDVSPAAAIVQPFHPVRTDESKTEDFSRLSARSVPGLPDRPDLVTPPPPAPAGEDDDLWDEPPPMEAPPEYNAAAPQELAEEPEPEKDLLDHGIHARHTPMPPPPRPDKLPRLEDADLDKLIQDLPLPEGMDEEEPVIPAEQLVRTPNVPPPPRAEAKDDLDEALDAIDAPVRPEPPNEDTDPERTNTVSTPVKDDLDFFSTNALPENWGKLGDADEMAIAGAKSGLGEVDFEDTKREDKMDFVGVGPAEDSADRLAVLEHRLGMVEQYVEKANEDRAAGLINEEMWQEETDRWSVEKEKLTKEIADLRTKRDAA